MSRRDRSVAATERLERGMAQESRQDLTGFAGSRVAITGGLGFIGSALAARLVELGAKVLLIDSLAPNYGGNLFNIAPIRDRVEVAIVDIRETQRLKPLLEGCDHLFNLAGQTSHLDSMHDPVTDLEINSLAQLT
jgi:UDP-glucose 4-epimerase